MLTLVKKIQQETNLHEHEVWWLLEALTDKNKVFLVQQPATFLSQKEQEQLAKWCDQIITKHMPLAYILETVPFLDLYLQVQPPILIPRPETEEWVHQLIQILLPHASNISNILDIGTGSGCIAISLAKHFPHAHILAIDIDQAALQLAAKNAASNNAFNITFMNSDVYEKLTNKVFDLIVANPPYIDQKYKTSIMPQVMLWENHQALFAAEQGLHLLQKIIKDAHLHVSDQPTLPYQLVLEHDHDQKDAVHNIADEANFMCTTQKDSFGNFRTSWCKKK